MVATNVMNSLIFRSAMKTHAQVRKMALNELLKSFITILVDCELEDWSHWTRCVPARENSSDGEQYRYRAVKVRPKNGGEDCDSFFEIEHCHYQNCSTPSNTQITTPANAIAFICLFTIFAQYLTHWGICTINSS